ncbi:MAG: valine--tRNA ligase [Alphaproteobacteria bacterium 32-64-14]|nr:MAG: valine--tRNA ligase [Alphaproteobacteria bacterium 32-64-14]
MIDDRYDHKAAEPAIYDRWEKSGAFKPSGDGEPYAIVIPPPNVTGVLHMGHALNNTLQDILIRFHRMKGFRTLWQPGTDHAGIATQMVVERQLAQEGNAGRRELGRDKFLERVWTWKEQSGGTILNQLKRLGASCDWSRERFTMDAGLSEAVTKVFVDLHREGLIYRDKRLVNWDPQFQTAISDLEVETREVKGHFWHFKYPLADGVTYKYVEKDADGNVTLEEERAYIAVATTRPETMLGDVAVAVNPNDERYKSIVGLLVKLPLVGRLIPIVADDYADPAQGSGAVKITPAHDFNDYQVGKRHGLEMINIFTDTAHLNDSVPEKYRGHERFAARKMVVADIEAEGCLIRVEDKTIMQPFGDRSQVVIEPYLTDQWYVDAATLAKPAIEAVESGKTKFVPGNWDKTYYEWMRNIEPWCVSRQLWWGHRIPAWYGPEVKPGKGGAKTFDWENKRIFVALTEQEALLQASNFYGTNGVSIVDDWASVVSGSLVNPNADTNRAFVDVRITRDDDVLDTWFSSALWPFSTMGWPGDVDPALKEFYPGAVLVTAFDIIFFWVARMMMQGLHFMGEVPFKDVYIHALVRDEKGQKMSKSKGNTMDPLDIIDGVDLETLVKKRTTGLMNPKDAQRIEKETRGQYPEGIPSYGTDALRFTLAALATQGRDIKLSMKTVEGYRNFSTKLWNAARFAELNGAEFDAGFDPASAKHTLNRWIISEAAEAVAAVEAGIKSYRFNEAAGAAYRFVWNVFCDWYVELTKPVLNGADEAAKAETRATTAWALDVIVHILHPFMPFVTEALFASLNEGSDRGLLISRKWPELGDKLVDKAAMAEVDWVIRLITAIRSTRSDLNVPAGAKVPLTLVGASAETAKRLETYKALVERLARVENVWLVPEAPKGAVRIVMDEATACLDIASLIDLKAEIVRLDKEVARLKGEIDGIDKKLANAQFVAKAPPEVIEEQHTRRTAAVTGVEKLSDALVQLKAAG